MQTGFCCRRSPSEQSQADAERQQAAGGPRVGGTATRQDFAPGGGRIGEKYGRQAGKILLLGYENYKNKSFICSEIEDFVEPPSLQAACDASVARTHHGFIYDRMKDVYIDHIEGKVIGQCGIRMNFRLLFSSNDRQRFFYDTCGREAPIFSEGSHVRSSISYPKTQYVVK